MFSQFGLNKCCERELKNMGEVVWQGRVRRSRLTGDTASHGFMVRKKNGVFLCAAGPWKVFFSSILSNDYLNIMTQPEKF